MKLTPLQELYNQYLREFNRTAEHPHPSELLALLLLPEKEKYPTLTGNLGKFYLMYKEDIDEKIEKVTVDFAISKNEFINYIEEEGIFYEEQRYEEYKIWHVFVTGIEVVLWGNMYHKDETPEKLHNDCSSHWKRAKAIECLFEESTKIGKPKVRTRRKNEIPNLIKGVKF